MKDVFLLLPLLLNLAHPQVINQISFDRFSHYDPDDWITYAYSNHITAIDFSDDYIYFGTNGGGILRFNLWDEKWDFPLTTSTGLRSNRIQKVVFSPTTNELYATTEVGVDSYIESFGYFTPYGFSAPLSMQADSLGAFDNTFPPYARPPIDSWPNFITEPGYEIMLDGTIYNEDSQLFRVTDKIVDKWNRLWFGTNGAGIGIVDLNSQRVDFLTQSIVSNAVNDIFIMNQNLWFGGKGSTAYNDRGITYWDYEYDLWSAYRAGFNFYNATDNVNIIEGKRANIFFGTDNGLLLYNNQAREWSSFSTLFPLKDYEIIDLCLLKNNLYIANTNGVFKYNISENYATQIAGNYIRQTKVNSLACSDTLIYIATNFGLFQYSPVKGTTKMITIKAALSGNFINTIAVGEDHLWLAANDGVAVYTFSDAKWISFPALNYSLKSRINHITLTEQFVWFATDAGLLRYDPINDYWYLYTRKDGLVSDKINRIDVDGDYLWLSTNKGVTLFAWNREGRKE